jgi:hypothetical protein
LELSQLERRHMSCSRDRVGDRRFDRVDVPVWLNDYRYARAQDQPRL